MTATRRASAVQSRLSAMCVSGFATLATFATIATSVPSPAMAQTTDRPAVGAPTDSAVAAKRAALQRLRTVTPVRVHAGDVIYGDYRETRGDSVRLTTREGSVTVALPDVRRIDLKHRKTAKGALIGGVTTGALGALLFIAAGRAFCDGGQSCGDDDVGLGVYGLAIGAVPGALIGALIGTAVTDWRPIYPTTPPPAKR